MQVCSLCDTTQSEGEVYREHDGGKTNKQEKPTTDTTSLFFAIARFGLQLQTFETNGWNTEAFVAAYKTFLDTCTTTTASNNSKVEQQVICSLTERALHLAKRKGVSLA